MADFVVAIPSYRRYEILRDKTLSLLCRHHINPSSIDVFVADEAEGEAYLATLLPGTYGRLIVAVEGMGAVRNFITAYYPVGARILNLDDDLDDLLSSTSSSTSYRLSPLEDLNAFVLSAFAESDRLGLRLWGVYPVANGYFMRGVGVTTSLRYIVGAFWGITNPGLDGLRVTLDDKEDFERTILMYLADGGVMRYRHVAVSTRYYRNVGGMSVARTRERVAESARLLHQAFPELTTLRHKRSGLDIHLRDTRD